MSESHEVIAQKQTTSTLQISLPTEPCERWRVAGSHAGTVPVSVGDLFRQTINRTQTRTRRVTLVMLATLLSMPVTLWATDQSQVGPSQRKCSHSVTWYFQSGQWRADIRTLKAASEFLLDDDAKTATPAQVAK